MLIFNIYNIFTSSKSKEKNQTGYKLKRHRTTPFHFQNDRYTAHNRRNLITKCPISAS